MCLWPPTHSQIYLDMNAAMAEKNVTPGSATYTQLLVAITYVPRELTAPDPLDLTLKGRTLQRGGGSAYDQ